ncbi:MAG: DUF1540 domain-containing protein [Clostridiales bacterium]|jgi:hypothetical protein|nr:DUF1540 domain-containing protein [Clostridiales bacterium]MDR2090962.1 DUF1540 domain-containing protein [Clostridiales bacterium]
MNDLKCTTANCEHNIRSNCTAGIISVGGNAVCGTKVKREGSALAQKFAELEAAAEISAAEKEKVYVQCDAECIYNKEHVCTAEKILVSDTFFNTKCATRRKN